MKTEVKKFKYLKGRGDYEKFETEFYTKVDNPLPYKKLPYGKYLIRGDKKDHRKEYINTKKGWYLTSESVRDNGHYTCDAARYLLFPNLPEATWDSIRNAGYKRLNKYWQRALAGHDFWIELRELRRNNRKLMLK